MYRMLRSRHAFPDRIDAPSFVLFHFIMDILVTVLQLCVGLLALPAYVLKSLGLWDTMCKKLFPHVMAQINILYSKRMHPYKRELFSNMVDFVGPSGKLNLLEIGCGAGSNFQYFPRGCKVTSVDPNANFKLFLSKSLAEHDHIQFERSLVASGEDMSDVANTSMDVVVSTLVLCSVQSVEAVLKEVLRILRPGGVFYFIEHVSADQSTWSHVLQQICQPTWKCVFDECNLNRETWKDLERANFSDLKLQHIWAPLQLCFLTVRPHIIGYAVK